jgi:serine/threonine protein kinase
MKVVKTDKLEATLAMKDAEIIMDLDHPNVLRYDEFFYNEDSKQLSIVMEYLPCKL